MLAKIIIQQGEGSPRSCDLMPGSLVTLGRSKDNRIILMDEHASRQHAQIFFDDGRWHVRDLGSFNGTEVDGRRVDGVMPLADGQIIGIADMRLVFRLAQSSADEANGPASTAKDLPSSGSGTVLWPDELANLYDYMSRTVGQADAHAVIELTLQTVQKQTGATLAGFLNLDADKLLSKMVLPASSEVNDVLSKQLTQRVQDTKQSAWLRSGSQGFSATESIASYTDALCVPVKSEDELLGALHLYKDRRTFSEREVQFCEIVAGYAAANLSRLRLVRKLAADNARLRGREMTSEQLLGGSTLMANLRQAVGRAAGSAATVLIRGETGAGKEVVAQTLHHSSPRSKGPFVCVNCGALNENLIEAELFGHAKGAFTGATTDRPGLFQQADDGTLFLDEIGDLPAEAQVKLLRIIEGKPFRRVGGTADVRVDVRVLAATHRDLAKEVEAGKFRQDLYFRLNVVVIQVPPLRDHREDVAQLAAHFLQKMPTRSGRLKGLTSEALKRLMEHDWPGNVRELSTVLERAVIMGNDGPAIEAGELILETSAAADRPLSWKKEDVEAWVMAKVLAKHGGNQSKAAEEMNIGRDTFTAKMKEYKLGKFKE